MTRIVYNDIEFLLRPHGGAWDIERRLADGGIALLGSALFAGQSAEQAAAHAEALIRAACPVGVKLVGPDVNHPIRIGALKLVGPAVKHPNFVRWAQDSSSFAPLPDTPISTTGSQHAD